MKIMATRKNRNSWLALAVFISLLLLSWGRVFATKFFSLVNVSNMPAQLDTLPAIAIDNNNKVHIAWNGFFAQAEAPDGVAGDVFYTTNKDGSFSIPVKINVSGGWYSRDVSIAVDPSGKVHIAFRRSENQTAVMSDDDLFYVTNALGDFSSPVLLIDGAFAGEDWGPYSPRIHCDSQGHVHLTFLANGLNGFYGVVGYMNNTTGSWSEPVVAAQSSFLLDYNSCLDRNGHIHIAFGAFPDKLRIYYTNNAGGSFEAPIAVSPSDENADEPNLAVDSKGNAHIVYVKSEQLTFDEPSIYYVNNIGGSFGTDQPIGDSSMDYIPTVACDASDFVHIAYKIGPAFGGALYYGNNIKGDFSFVTYDGMNSYWFPGWSQSYMVLGKNGTMHIVFYDWVGDVYNSDTEIYYLSGSWLDLDDFVGTWDGQGVYSRNTQTGQWVRLTSPMDSLAAGDIDGDGAADLLGVFSSGLWVKYSKTKTWAKLSANVPLDIASGDMNGDGQDDVIGSWTSGVWYRNSKTGSWVLMSSSPATRVAAGDINGDGKDDLIGVWTSGSWVKYSVSGSWDKLSGSLARDIASGDMSGDGRDDVLGTWSSGVWQRNSATGSWVLMSSSSATRVAAGAIDADAADDLIGVWPTGVWVKNSSDSGWTRISLTLPRDIDAGLFSAGWGSGSADDNGPPGGNAVGSEGAMSPLDYSSEGPGGWRFAYQEEKNLVPQNKDETMTRIPGPGDPGFEWTEQENLFPQEGEKIGGKTKKK